MGVVEIILIIVVLIGLVIIVLIIFLAIIGPMISGYASEAIDQTHQSMAPRMPGL